MRRNATDWKEIFPKDKSNKGLIFKVHKEVFYLSGKKRRNVLQPGVLPQLSNSLYMHKYAHERLFYMSSGKCETDE